MTNCKTLPPGLSWWWVANRRLWHRFGRWLACSSWHGPQALASWMGWNSARLAVAPMKRRMRIDLTAQMYTFAAFRPTIQKDACPCHNLQTILHAAKWQKQWQIGIGLIPHLACLLHGRFQVALLKSESMCHSVLDVPEVCINGPMAKTVWHEINEEAFAALKCATWKVDHAVVQYTGNWHLVFTMQFRFGQVAWHFGSYCHAQARFASPHDSSTWSCTGNQSTRGLPHHGPLTLAMAMLEIHLMYWFWSCFRASF